MKTWTNDEDKYIQDNWKIMSDDDLAKNLGKSIEALKSRRSKKLKLYRKPSASHEKNKHVYDYEEVLSMFNQKDYILLSKEYVNQKTSMEYICKKHYDCGVQHITLGSILRGRGCYYCGRERTEYARKLPESYWIEECEDRDYTYVGRHFENGRTIVEFICNKHEDKGVQYKDMSNFRATHSCKYCKISNGEIMVSNVLDVYNVPYIFQKRFDDCKDNNTLPFDFYLYTLNTIIEYDGEQHFYPPVWFFNGDEEKANNAFNESQKRDKIKTDYCIANNINLIRIPYWEYDDIEKIIIKELEKIGFKNQQQTA